ncbi:MAG: PA domain-containing protein [Bacteroidota bacterium]
MKKVLLSIAFGLAIVTMKAQVVFNIQSPAGLAGNYTMTYADPTGGWGCPDLMDPANSVSDTIVIVDDGTSADSLGCNALINDAAMAGHIAMVFRGDCEFGTKALMAETAGAIAVIIVNNVPGDPVGMAPGADGANVTIPVIMITQIDGSNIQAAINNDEDVTVFIGNKFGLFDNDLGFTNDRMLLPNPNTQHSLLAASGAEYSFRVGGWVYNFGNLEQVGGTMNAVVTFNGNSIYDETMTLPTMASGDTVLAELPLFTQATYAAGKYTVTYTLTLAGTDEYDGDNTFSTNFFISDDVLTYVPLDDNGLPVSTTGYRTSAQTTNFTSCIHFRDNNASRVKAQGLYFAATTNADSDLLGQEFIVTAYQLDDDFTDLNDPNAAIESFQELSTGSYTYAEDSMDFVTVYGEFGSEVVLEDNQRYLFCVTTFDENTFIGYGALNYNLVLDEYAQPLFPIQTDAGFNILGFGGESSAIGVKLASTINAGVAENKAAELKVFPNPAKNVIHIQGNDAQLETAELKDQLGRTVGTWNISAKNTSIDVSKFNSGNYILVLKGSNSLDIKKVQINN